METVVGGSSPRGWAVSGSPCTGGLRARVLHETENWPMFDDLRNAFTTVKKMPVLAGVVTYVPALVVVVAYVLQRDTSWCLLSGRLGTIHTGRSLAPEG